MNALANAISVVPRIAIVTVASLSVFSGGTAAEMRRWTAKSGHWVMATLEDQTEDTVSLRIQDRPQPVVVKLNLLMEADQQFVRQQAGRKKQVLSIGKPGAHAERMKNSKFAEQSRLRRERRLYALENRRAYNANKGPAIYKRPGMPDTMLPFGSGIQNGWIKQPPIPMPWYFIF